VGGVLFPPVIGVVAGVTGLWVNIPVTLEPTRICDFLAELWPWTLIAFLVWMFGQFVVGHFFNDLLMRTGLISPLLILGLTALSVASAFANDARREASG